MFMALCVIWLIISTVGLVLLLVARYTAPRDDTRTLFATDCALCGFSDSRKRKFCSQCGDPVNPHESAQMWELHLKAIAFWFDEEPPLTADGVFNYLYSRGLVDE